MDKNTPSVKLSSVISSIGESVSNKIIGGFANEKNAQIIRFIISVFLLENLTYN